MNPGRRAAILRQVRWTASAVRDYVSAHTTRHPGADLMVDVFRSLGFEYLFANPSASFGAIHESLLRHGGNRSPEFITCAHEELAVAMADGYYKISGRPGLVCVHGTVGLQHAAMAVYNSYCDQVPIYLVLGNTADAASRRGRVEWVHSAQDPSALVRDFIKWSDHPVSLTHFAESAVRAYEIAMTPPRLPVVLVADSALQQRPRSESLAAMPRLCMPQPPHADPAALQEIAKLLVGADNPVIVAGRAARSPAGLRLMVELANLLQAGVIDEGWRLNFPTRHALNQSIRPRAALRWADVVLGLEPDDLFTVVHRLRGQLRVLSQPVTPPGAKLIRLGIAQLTPKPNYQTAQRRLDLHLDVVGDAEASLPSLIEAVRRELNTDRQRHVKARGQRWAEDSAHAREQFEIDSRSGWDARPVSTARLSAELWQQLRHENWSLVSFTRRMSNWPLRLWDFTEHHQFIGGPGGDGVGYTAPAAAGAALANRAHGRLSVCLQPDGDLLSSSSILWTLAHHCIPLLTVMHNNRAYHEERMKLRRLSRRHGADNRPSRMMVGTTLDDPNIDFAGLARSMGVEAEGPLLDPNDLSAALARGIAAVKAGRPYLIDVVTRPR